MRAALTFQKPCMQNFMAQDDCLKATLQSFDVQHALKPCCSGDVVGVTAGGKLIKKPEPLLTGAKRLIANTISANNWRDRMSIGTRSQRFDVCRQFSEHWQFEQRSEGNITTKYLAQAQQHLRGQQ